jgi:hypothetical protein
METELLTWMELLGSNTTAGIIKCAKRRECTKSLLSAHCVMTSHDNYLIYYVPFGLDMKGHMPIGLNMNGHMPIGQIGTKVNKAIQLTCHKDSIKRTILSTLCP